MMRMLRQAHRVPVSYSTLGLPVSWKAWHAAQCMGCMHVTHLQERYPDEMVAAVNEVAQQRLQEGLQLKAAQHERWWRLREAALAAVSTQLGSGLLDDDEDGGGGTGASRVPDGLDVRAILNGVLEHDLRPRDTPPFLRGRALWVAAKLASALPEVCAAVWVAR